MCEGFKVSARSAECFLLERARGAWINVTESYVVAEWSRRLGCTPGELRATAAAVGNVGADIEAHLRPVQDAAQEQDALRAAFVDAPEQPVGTSIARDE